MVVEASFAKVLEGTQQAIKAMKDNEEGGAVINVASMGGLLPMPQAPIYGATKAGVIHFSRSLAEFGRFYRIRVNAIWYGALRSLIHASLACEQPLRASLLSPTFTDTPLVRENPDEVVEVLKQSIGGRLLQPSDVAQVRVR